MSTIEQGPISDPVTGHPEGLVDALHYPYFQSVFDRKSRRMALGMEMEGVLGYQSPYAPIPLTELEEALLLVAGTGLTGLNLGDIDPSMGADALMQWTARTWPSSCSNHGTELFFTNDDGLYFLDMWNLMPEEGGDLDALRQVDRAPGGLHARARPAGEGAAVGQAGRASDRFAGAVRLQPLETRTSPAPRCSCPCQA